MQLPHEPTTRTCHECLTEGHAPDATFCFHCSARLPTYQLHARTPEGPAPTPAS
jgi:voltage-gated potassium channel